MYGAFSAFLVGLVLSCVSPTIPAQISETLFRALSFPKHDLSGYLTMSIRRRQLQGNVVASDDPNVAGLDQIRPRQFHPPR